MNKLEFSKLNKKEDMILAFNQLKDDYRQLFAINDDLQSKIDKAIDKINQYELIVGYYDSNYDEYDDTYSHEIKDELLDILKEDK